MRVQDPVGDQVLRRLRIEAKVVLVHLLVGAGLHEVKLDLLECPSVLYAVDIDGDLVGSANCLSLTFCRESLLMYVISGH